MTTDFDIVVIGAGPVGAGTAALLACHSGVDPARIALLAPELAAITPAATPLAIDARTPPELRVAALSRASEQILRHAGAWDHLPAARLCAYERMRVWHASVPADGAAALCFDAAELAEPNLGYIVENRALANAALSSFRERGGVLLASNVSALNSSAECVTLHAAGGTHTARLVIGADGARSQVREWLGIEISAHDYQQSAIVATVATARPHQHTAWQRFLASGPLALLPLFDGSCSIVWSADKALADELMQLDSVEFAARLTAASDGVLGGIRLVSERLAVPLQRRVARRLIGPRSALLGDAAHVVHPLAGQGFNLGLLDAAALAEALALAVQEREDPGAARVLRRYEQARLTHNALMSASMSAFNELFSRGPGPGGWLAARLLGLAGASATTRRWFARRALGLSGELPSLARGGRLARAASW